jgi:chromosomal replication initiation ATPase DnaA
MHDGMDTTTLFAMAMQYPEGDDTRRKWLREAARRGFEGVPATLLPEPRRMPASALRIVAEVAWKHRLPPRALFLKIRTREVVRARHEAMARMHEEMTHASTPQIGRWFGNYDHTTVIHAVKKHRKMREAVE